MIQTMFLKKIIETEPKLNICNNQEDFQASGSRELRVEGIFLEQLHHVPGLEEAI